MNSDKKNFVIFDFDQTITNYDSLFEQLPLLHNEEEEKKIIQMDAVGNFVDSFNYFYTLAKKLKISLDQINEAFTKIQVTPGISELFQFFRENKKNYEVIIISSNFLYAIEKILEANKIRDVVTSIFCNPNKIDDEGGIVVLQKETHNCPLCNPCQCKSNELKKFFSEKNKENYKRICFVADGGNDLCLTEFIGENDISFPRKGYTLYKKVNDPANKDKIKCKIVPWTNANEIKNYLFGLN